MDLLTNAIESIQVGVEDYRDGSRPRLLSAVRNIHAGILLLYKEALRRRSPENSNEVLIKSNIHPREPDGGDLEFFGVGKKTVDVQQIKDRFKSLNIVTDWNCFKVISDVRNNIEHYYTTISQRALQGMLTNALAIIRAFVKTELEDDPLELLGDTTWKFMLGVAEIYEEEHRECLKAIDTIEWQSDNLSGGIQELGCQKCGSDLLAPTDTAESYDEVTLRCRACGNEECAESFVPRAVQNGLAFDMYRSGRDGAEMPYVSCPECGLDSYIVEEKRCAWCGHEADHICRQCGNPIPPGELNLSPYCGYCDYMINKDD